MAKTHYISPTELGFDEETAEQLLDNWNEDNEYEVADRLEAYLKFHHHCVARGDLVSIIRDEERYRNTYAYIYDGNYILTLDCRVDEYGAVPAEVPITESQFSIGWWSMTGIIRHNNLFFLANDLLARLRFTKHNQGYFYAPLSLRALVGGQIELREFWVVLDDEKNSPSDLLELIDAGRYNKIFCELVPSLLDDHNFILVKSKEKSWLYEAEKHPLIFIRGEISAGY